MLNLLITICQERNPNRSEADKRSSQYIIVDDIRIFVTIWEIYPRRSSCYWQLENAVLRELYEVAILAATDINIQTFRGKTPADYQLEAVYLPAQRRN